MLYRPLGSLGFYLGHEYTKRFNPANMSVFSKPKSSAFIGHDAFTRVPPAGRLLGRWRLAAPYHGPQSCVSPWPSKRLEGFAHRSQCRWALAGVLSDS
jgi:hypothetical protein